MWIQTFLFEICQNNGLQKKMILQKYAKILEDYFETLGDRRKISDNVVIVSLSSQKFMKFIRYPLVN